MHRFSAPNNAASQKHSEIIGRGTLCVGRCTSKSAKGSEIIGQLASLMANSLIKTANAAIEAHQTHKSGPLWPLMQP